MSKRDLQKTIRENGGLLISTDTYRLDHILAATLGVIEDFNLKGNPFGYITDKPFRQEIKDQFILSDWGREVGITLEDARNDLRTSIYYGYVEFKDEDQAYSVWHEAEGYFQQIAPNGYYFGSNEGNGTDIGWLEIGEETA